MVRAENRSVVTEQGTKTMQSVTELGPTSVNEMFTPRELELIRLIIEYGLSTSEAAGELQISPKTAEVHRAHIMEKLRAALKLPECRPIGPVDLALFAITNRLVDCGKIERKYT